MKNLLCKCCHRGYFSTSPITNGDGDVMPDVSFLTCVTCKSEYVLVSKKDGATLEDAGRKSAYRAIEDLVEAREAAKIKALKQAAELEALRVKALKEAAKRQAEEEAEWKADNEAREKAEADRKAQAEADARIKEANKDLNKTMRPPKGDKNKAEAVK